MSTKPREAPGLDPEAVHFASACLLCTTWRAVDLPVQVEFTGEYEHSPVVTARNKLALLKKETGIG